MREQRRTLLRDLVLEVRMSKKVAQPRYKRSYDKRVNPFKQALRVGDWVYVESHAKDRKKLEQAVAGP